MFWDIINIERANVESKIGLVELAFLEALQKRASLEGKE